MRFLATALILAALAAWPASSTAQSTVNIDVLLPLTGPTAFAGTAQQAAARVYEATINKTGGIHGTPLHFEFHDDQSNPAIAVQLVNEVLAKHPIAILGPSVTATCAAVAPLFVNGPVNFCFSPAILPPHGGNVFASSVTLHDSEMAMFNRAKKMGFKRFAQIAATDASGQLALQNIKEWQVAPANKDVQVVAVEAFAPNDLSVAAQVAKIKAANPDIIYLNAIGTAFGTALRELNNAGLSNVVMVTTPANGSVTQLATYRAFLPKTLLTVGMPYQGKITNPAMNAAAAEFLDGIRDAGVKFDPMQAYAWDPIKITISALRSLPAGATAAQLHNYLENLHDFAGLWGVYDFRTGDQHGIDGRDTIYIYYDDAHGTWAPYDRPNAKS
jgi:branched-chain amino acid transport system substrate-binding protein